MDKYKDLAEASTSVNCRGRRLCYGHVPKQDGKKGPKAHPAQFSVPKKCINGLSLLGVLLIANQFGGNSKRTDDHWQELRLRGRMWHRGLIQMIFKTSWNAKTLKTCMKSSITDTGKNLRDGYACLKSFHPSFFLWRNILQCTCFHLKAVMEKNIFL